MTTKHPSRPRTLIASTLLVTSAVLAMAFTPDPDRLPKVLVFSKTAGFRHQSIPDGIKALKEIGAATPAAGSGEKAPATEKVVPIFQVEATEDAAIFTDEALAPFAAIVFLSTTGDILDDAQQAAFERYMKKGRGFVGIHAASDTEHTWPWYGAMIGAYFKGHPEIQPATVIVEDRTHPSTSMLPERWERTDEWYYFDKNPRTLVKVLARLDETSYKPGAGAMGDHPIAWYHEYGGGRVWYTAGGHTSESFSEVLFRDHLRGGILWAIGSTTRPAVTPSDSTKPAER